MEEHIKNILLEGNEVVVQDNRLLEAQKPFTLQEYKLFLFLISKYLF